MTQVQVDMADPEFKGYALVLKSGADPTTGGVAIAGFTTAGMVGVIAASHIIRTLRLNQLGTVLNADFPAVALIQDEIPKHPVRVTKAQVWVSSPPRLNFKISKISCLHLLSWSGIQKAGLTS